MSEKFSSNQDEWRLENEVANRTDSRGGGEKNVKTTDIIEEESGYSKDEKWQAHNRTSEVAERIKKAEEIDKQRGILAGLGMKLGVVEKTTEKDIAFNEAKEENKKIDDEKMRRKSEMDKLQKEADEKIADKKSKERTAALKRNTEISQRMVDIDIEVRKLVDAEELCIKEERDRIDGGRTVIYSINPDGTPNDDPKWRPQNSTNFVEGYRSKRAKLRKEKESLKKEFDENRSMIEAS